MIDDVSGLVDFDTIDFHGLDLVPFLLGHGYFLREIRWSHLCGLGVVGMLVLLPMRDDGILRVLF